MRGQLLVMSFVCIVIRRNEWGRGAVNTIPKSVSGSASCSLKPLYFLGGFAYYFSCYGVRCSLRGLTVLCEVGLLEYTET